MFGKTSLRARTWAAPVIAASLIATSAVIGGAAAAAAESTPPTPALISAGPETGRTFTVGVNLDADSLNPFTGNTVQSYNMWGLMYDTLTGYSAKDFTAVPGLAEKWEISADQKTWTFTIRSGATFNDGTPVTARDAAYTINRVMKGKYEQTNWGGFVANIAKAEAASDTSLVITTKQPTPVLLHFPVPILPEHIWKDIDQKAVKSFANEPSADKPVVGSGPFTLVEHKKGQFLRFKPTPGYWGGAPSFESLTFRIFNNADALGQALKRGEIDYAYDMQSNVWKSLANTQGITTSKAKPASFSELAINYGAALSDGTPIGDGNPLLKDIAVRQAMAHAIDLKALVAKVLGGNGLEGESVIPPIYSALYYESGAKKYAYDPAKAMSILESAGYAKGSDGVYAKDGKRLSFRLFGRTDNANSKASVEFIKGFLAAVGIETTIKMVSGDALTELIGQGNFDLFEWGWGVDPDPDYMLSTFTCDKRSYKEDGTTYADLSDSFFCDKQYDELYAKQAQQTDENERAATVKQMQEILYTKIPYIVTYYEESLQAYRSDKWTGFVPQPEQGGSLYPQYGAYSLLAIKPASDEATVSTESTGVATWVWVVAGVAVVGIGGLIAARRRKGNADNEE